MFVSVFNDVLGPIMRGPSSSHTAGSYHIGITVRHLLGTEPSRVKICFDQNGSYARTYVQQGVDQAFCTGLMGWKQTDKVFTRAVESAQKEGVSFEFEVRSLSGADHPNFVLLEVESRQGEKLTVEAKSIGGGTFQISRVNGNEVHLDGKSYSTLLILDHEISGEFVDRVKQTLPASHVALDPRADASLLQLSSNSPIPELLYDDLDWHEKRVVEPVYFTQKQAPPFTTASELVVFAEKNGLSLGAAVLHYETTVLTISEPEAIEQMVYRYEIMKQSVAEGLNDETADMLLLEPTAGSIMKSIREQRVPIGTIHARASAAALAAMHTCNSQGVVCAAPTGGAAGTIPGIMTALEEDYSLTERELALILFAAGGIGLILARRATFAAEVAGCQVEIGAAGAMGAAAVVEFAGGTVKQACDAAAVSFQNTMGMVCDLVQGMCELPCHTRNGIAASSAFTTADMILGGYVNHINLDETIDAVYSSGMMLPAELRCTARGGLSMAPSALALKPRR